MQEHRRADGSGRVSPLSGTGRLAAGDRVSEAPTQFLLGMGRDPISGGHWGWHFPAYKSPVERIEARIADLDPALGRSAKAAAVAGFDFTFLIPKSASALWAVADAGVQASIGEAHHAAIAEVVAFIEREVAATRTCATAGDGAVAQVSPGWSRRRSITSR